MSFIVNCSMNFMGSDCGECKPGFTGEFCDREVELSQVQLFIIGAVLGPVTFLLTVIVVLLIIIACVVCTRKKRWMNKKKKTQSVSLNLSDEPRYSTLV